MFISSLLDIARTVEDSAIVNPADLVGLHNGTVLIPTYDWMSYLDTFFQEDFASEELSSLLI